MRTREISNTDDIIDSRDVIERIEELESEQITTMEPTKLHSIHLELEALTKLQSEADCSPDWIHGEGLIHEDYFTEYIKELINDCYEMPKEFSSGSWPWNHVVIDWESAADEAKQDYMEVDFDGSTYLIRA